MSYRRVSLPAVLIALWTVAGLIVLMQGSLHYVNGAGLRQGLQASGRMHKGVQKAGSSRSPGTDPVALPVESKTSSGTLIGTVAVAAAMVSVVLATPGAALADSVEGAKFDMKMSGFSKDASYGSEVKAFTRSDGASIRVGPVDYRRYEASHGIVNKLANQRLGPGNAVKKVVENSRGETADVLEYQVGQPPAGLNLLNPSMVPAQNETSPYVDMKKALPENHVWVKSIKKNGKDVAAMIVEVPVSAKLSEEKASVDAILKSFKVDM